MKRKEQTKSNLLFLIPAVVVILLLLFFRRRLSHILLSLLLAFLISYMMEPSVRFLQKKMRLRRISAIAVTYLLFFATLILILSFLIPGVVSNLKGIIEHGDSLQQSVDQLLDYLCQRLGSNTEWKLRAREFLEETLNKGVKGVENWALSLLDRLAQSLLSFFSAVLDVITGFILAFYLLKDKELMSNWVLSLFPYTWRDTIAHTAHDLGKISTQFIQGQFLLALIVGTLETIGLSLIGVPFPVVLGIIGGLSNVVPYFGPFIGAVPSVLAALLVSPGKAFWTAILFVAVQQLDNNFLGPKIIEGKLGIHPVATILVVFIGGEFFGITGILLAVPVYAMLRCILRRIRKSSHRQDPEVAA